MSRYLQQQLVSEVSRGGQQKIRDAKVLVIGAGGLGVPLATYLTGAGIGKLGIVDGDTVVVSNLHRQFLYTQNDIGEKKAEVLKERLKVYNPDVELLAYPKVLDHDNAQELFSGYDIICDCTDRVEARILIAENSKVLQKPLVYAAVLGWEAYVTVLNHHNNINLEDIFSFQQMKENASNSCSVNGIINAVCGVAASTQAGEVLKIILGLESKLDGEILCMDTLTQVYRFFKIKKHV